MNTKFHWFLTFVSSGFIVAAVAIWMLFAPTRLGGHVEYVFIQGNSMEPRVHQGDLVIVRKNNEYHIGDAVAYKNNDLQRVVFHRVIGGNILHFFMQGDNNARVDGYEPAFQEIIGKEWLLVPGAGKVVEWIRKPVNAALTVGVLGGFLMAFGLMDNKKKNKKSTAQTGTKTRYSNMMQNTSSPTAKNPIFNQQKQKNSNISLLVEIGIFCLGFLSLASLVLFIFSFTKPVIKTSNPEYPYTQSVNYEYNAPAPAGVYDTPALVSGDPVFTNLTCQINLLVKYKIEGVGLAELSGTHYLTAAISDPVSGWKRTFPLESQQFFDGDNFSSLVMVDLCQIRSAATDMETQTGASSYNYALSIEPNIIQTGSIQGTQLLTSFNTALPFLMDNNRVFISRADESLDPLNPVSEKVQSTKTLIPNTLHLFSSELSIKTARIISLLGLILSIIGLWLLFTNISKASKQDKGMMVKLKYGGSLVDVAEAPLQNERAVVSVKEIDDLAKLAEKMDTVMLHHASIDKHYYYVEANGLTYLCILNQEFHEFTPPPLDLIVESEISRALKNREFETFYQPVVSLQDRKLVAVEAFIRWNHPNRGMLTAAEFFEEAKLSGDIVRLDEFTFTQAAAQVAKWKTSGLPIHLAINMLKIDVDPKNWERFEGIFKNAGLSSSDIQLEFSRANLVNDKPAAAYLNRLHESRFLLALENITSEEDLDLLDGINFDLVKIDHSLIVGIEQSEITAKVRSIVHACLLRGIKVVASGVETRSQVNIARSMGITYAQGYLIAHPAPSDVITLFLQNMIGKG